MAHADTVTTTAEDRTLPVIVYGLYLLGLTNGLTILIGLIIAYASRDNAGPAMRSHYTFQIYTFWISLVAAIAAGALIVFGGILSFILVGIPFLMLGIGIGSLIGLWFVVRCIVGLVHVSRGDAYPRPTNLVI